MSFTVFYAWQSDCPNKTNRSLIKEAAEEAISAINADATIEDRPVLDHDTKDTPGIPDISNTILEKIDHCGIFLADLTFVGASPAREAGGKPKVMPNSNVMIELGYAMKSVGPERIICVMNTAFGPPEELPFDLRHRRYPVQFCHKPEDEGGTAIRKALAKELKTAIRAIIARGIQNNGDGESGAIAKARSRAAQEMTEFTGQIKSGKYHGMLPSSSALLLSMTPAKQLDRPLDFSAIGSKVLQIPGFGNWDFGGNAMTFCQRDGKAVESACEITDQGIIHLADVHFWTYLDSIREKGEKMKQFATLGIKGLISSQAFEKKILNRLLSYGALMGNVGVPLPWVISVAALNVRDFTVYFWNAHDEVSRKLPKEDFLLPSTVVHNHDQMAAIAALGKIFKPAFDYFYREFGIEKSPNYDESGNWRMG
jgi:hypothetical protein